MSVTFRLTAAPTFPESTTVGAYNLTIWGGPPPSTGLKPPIAATTTAVVDSHGYAAFSGLEADTHYAAGAQVAGVWHYITFTTNPEAGGGGGITGPALEAEEAARAAGDTAEKERATAAEALKLAKASNLSDLASAITARTNLGLGTAATAASTAFATPASVTTEKERAEGAEALLQPLSEKGQVDGYAPLNGEGQVDPEYLPFEEIEPGGELGQFLAYVDENTTRWAFPLTKEEAEALIKSLALLRGTFKTISTTQTLAVNTYNDCSTAAVTVTVPTGPATGDWLVIRNSSNGLVKVAYGETFTLTQGRAIYLLGGNGAWNVIGELLPLYNGGVPLASVAGVGPTLWGGSGAPSEPAGTVVGTTLKTGDFYLRSDKPAGANERLYVCTNAGTKAWTGIA